MEKLGRFVVLLAIAGLVAVACVGSDDSSSAANDTPETPELLEKSKLRVGLLPIIDVAPFYIAIERGFFADEGLTVTPQFAAGGVAAIPALQNGDIDLAYGGYPSMLTAIQAGFPLVIVQDAVRSSSLSGGLYSLPDSGIIEPADLVGNTIAVNRLNNTVQIAVEAHLVDAGLSLNDVTLVELDFAEMVPALELGYVDVIATVEPYGTVAVDTLGARVVVDMFSGRLLDFPVAGWQATSEFVAENPNSVAAFNRALARATEVASNEDEALAEIVPTYTSVTADLAAMVNYPTMVSGLDTDSVQIVSDFMVDQRLLNEPISVADHVVE